MEDRKIVGELVSTIMPSWKTEIFITETIKSELEHSI